MEKVKVKRKKHKRKTLEKRIMERELALNELWLYNETIHSRMTQEAFLLERKRNPRDYIT
ncbi:MAG: hypothetical protein QXN36_00730 [Candidatus Bathyarchaeia archaeon]